ncbi:MAG TPA: glycosyl hydrolase 115 family protein [Paludibacteraceae bacterium]|mgnify:CR=1 FL=1|nr:glycosyl hydrolase 115 family protein [Paludibacteraceae bacterium]HPT42250.1 glycosyl hydrolase 115 family protein [Paludibacteraceae bacterium]
MKKVRLCIFLFVLFLCSQTSATGLVWFDGSNPISYSLPRQAAPVVKVAAGMFCDDMLQVTGFAPQQKPENLATIRIVQFEEKLSKQLKNVGIPVDELAGKRDAFFIKVSDKQLIVVGSDARGTAYGILELSRLAGVSPWIWWGDMKPDKKNRLAVPEDFHTLQSPSVEYRGIFINDEDWSLQLWSWKNFDPSDRKGLISAKTYREIFKLLLRLRANTIWPAMHGATVPFYFVPGAKEAADSCGIVIGTSHCEPLMRNNVGEWDEKIRGNFNFPDNHDRVISYWKERLNEVHQYENIYTIGMRGVHDGPMEGVSTLKEKTEALQQVINEQRELLRKHVNPDLSKVPQQFVPYKEVLDIYENGLKVPDDVMLTWCDDNYGYITRLSDEQQQKRSGGGGIYYHLSYWGRPHDYLWLTTTQPGLIYNEMMEAYKHNARRFWVVNVHDLKPAIYDLEFFLDMAWNINSIKNTSIVTHLEKWLCREFGREAGIKLLPAMTEYYRLSNIRRPEFMGWTKVEEDKKKYNRGLTPVIDTEFSLTEFGGELDRYLSDYEQIRNIVQQTESLISENRKYAFFAAIKYPVFGASAMAAKWLEAQRARYIALQDKDTIHWQNNTKLVEACTRSLNAYAEIQTLTDYWNNRMSGGKWKHSMHAAPRDLPVFDAPVLPLKTNGNDTERKYDLPLSYHATKIDQLEPDSFIARNACHFTRAGKQVKSIQMLGHSMNAVSLPRSESVSFEFDCPWEGEAVLRTAVIPTQPNDKGDIRFSVQIDDEKPKIISFRERGRTETWKNNVLRAQAVKTTGYTLLKGKHTLTITALDNHVLIDQWMIDFKKNRKFYVFPLTPAYGAKQVFLSNN